MNKFSYLFLAGILWACGSSPKEEKNNTSDTSTNNTETTVTETTEPVKKETVNSPSNVTLNFYNTYTGKINDKYEIVMKVEKSESYFTGTYKYKGKDQTIYLKSKSNTGNSYVLEEYVYGDNGTLVTGSFEGTFNDNIFSGTWFSADRSKSFPFSVKTNSSTFNFTSNISLIPEEYSSLTTFSILDANNNEVQKIEVEQSFPDSSITVEDMNFDGHSDIRIVNLVAANGNTNYSCWLYNPNSQKFENNKTLNMLIDPIFHQNTKQVETTWKEGYGTYGHETYQYQNNKYLLIESGYTNMNEEGEQKTTTTKYKIVDGKSVKIN